MVVVALAANRWRRSTSCERERLSWRGGACPSASTSVKVSVSGNDPKAPASCVAAADQMRHARRFFCGRLDELGRSAVDPDDKVRARPAKGRIHPRQDGVVDEDRPLGHDQSLGKDLLGLGLADGDTGPDEAQEPAKDSDAQPRGRLAS